MLISVEVDPPTRSDRRTSRIVGGVGAAVVVCLIVASLAHTSDTPTPTPTPAPTVNVVVDPVTASQETYVLYASWLNSEAFADCMTARGFSREAVAGMEHSRVERVAAFLGIEPQRPDSWLAPAEARNGHPASDHSLADQLNRALDNTKDGGCQGQQGATNLADVGAVTAAVNAARGDEVFGQYLAESAWLSSNPAEALLYQSHLLMSSVDADAPHAFGPVGSAVDLNDDVARRVDGLEGGPE